MTTVAAIQEKHGIKTTGRTARHKTHNAAIRIGTGELNVYDFGIVKMHAYKTSGFLPGEMVIFEKDRRAVVLEPLLYR